MKKFILICLVAIFFVSCKKALFLQRKYTKGVFREFAAKPKQALLVKNKIALKKVTKSRQSNTTEILLVSGDKKFLAIEKHHTAKLPPVEEPIIAPYGCGDTILFTNNKKVACKVHFVSEKGLRYRKCSRYETDLWYVKLKKVSSVKYENGLVEEFSESNFQSNSKKSNPFSSGDYIKGENMALVGYALSCVSGIVTMFALPGLGIIIALASLVAIIAIATKEEYNKGIHFVIIVGNILGWSALITVCAAVLALIIALIVLVAMFG